MIKTEAMILKVEVIPKPIDVSKKLVFTPVISRTFLPSKIAISIACPICELKTCTITTALINLNLIESLVNFKNFSFIFTLFPPFLILDLKAYRIDTMSCHL